MDEERIALLDAAISALEPGEFHLPEIYGSGWDELYVGEKVKLGRAFLKLVQKGHFSHVEDTGKKEAGGRVYLKRDWLRSVVAATSALLLRSADR